MDQPLAVFVDRKVPGGKTDGTVDCGEMVVQVGAIKRVTTFQPPLGQLTMAANRRQHIAQIVE